MDRRGVASVSLGRDGQWSVIAGVTFRSAGRRDWWPIVLAGLMV